MVERGDEMEDLRREKQALERERALPSSFDESDAL